LARNDDVIKEQVSHFVVTIATWCESSPLNMKIAALGNPVASMTTNGTWNALMRTPRAVARAAVRLYRLTLSPLVGFHCRYLPTCSDYAEQALERHGLWAGGWMTLARLMRCHPWGNSGLDFVPDAPPQNARWYLPWRYGRWRGANPSAPQG
jgi:putative membrane protein insertion efficiency factor